MKPIILAVLLAFAPSAWATSMLDLQGNIVEIPEPVYNPQTEDVSNLHIFYGEGTFQLLSGGQIYELLGPTWILVGHLIPSVPAPTGTVPTPEPTAGLLLGLGLGGVALWRRVQS